MDFNKREAAEAYGSFLKLPAVQPNCVFWQPAMSVLIPPLGVQNSKSVYRCSDFLRMHTPVDTEMKPPLPPVLPLLFYSVRQAFVSLVYGCK